MDGSLDPMKLLSESSELNLLELPSRFPKLAELISGKILLADGNLLANAACDGFTALLDRSVMFVWCSLSSDLRLTAESKRLL